MNAENGGGTTKKTLSHRTRAGGAIDCEGPGLGRGWSDLP